MKQPTSLRIVSVVLATVFLVASPNAAFAQAPTLTPTPTTTIPSPNVASTAASAQTPKPAKKGLSLRISATTLELAVQALLESREKEGNLPDLNVIYGPGVAQLSVPELNIRNVTPADGLRLIAASAGCETETISSVDDPSMIIGYKVVQSPGGMALSFDPRPGAGAMPGIPGPPTTNPLMASPGNRKPSTSVGPAKAARGASIQFTGPEGSPGAPGVPPIRNTSGERPYVNLTGDGRIVSMGLNPGSHTPVVRVYPLGNVTTIVKFAEIEATLRDVLKADGEAADATKLALHEKTNVLVVTGPARSHELVSQLIEALQRNQTAAENSGDRGQEFVRENTELRVRLDAQHRERDRIEQQLEKSETRLRELDQELSRLKSSAAKPQ